ncbi:GrpB family protein [Saccharothrix texasensis]|uniref:GrpB family protein n=1 Tax=Saccharothrix texasensis TaxID=103734 RepID=UPI0011CD8B93|nr:GrpB family protein [Saccharothrix texasensis]
MRERGALPARSGADLARGPALVGSTAAPGLHAKRFVDLQVGTRAKSAFFRSTG